MKAKNGLKKCSNCEQLLPVDKFNKDKTTADGLYYWCTQCAYKKELRRLKEKPRKHVRSSSLRRTSIRKVRFKREGGRLVGKLGSNQKCSRIGQFLPPTDFGSDPTKKYQLTSRCLECLYGQGVQYREDHKEEIHKRSPIAHKKHYAKNKVKILKKQRVYNKKYAKLNRKKINKERRTRHKEDLLWRLSTNLRVRLRQVLKQNSITKRSKFGSCLGCTVLELKVHMENQWTTGMSWANYGAWSPKIKRWQIDHITPLASATTEKEMRRLCHYTNLQPLWAMDNFKKGPRISDGHNKNQV